MKRTTCEIEYTLAVIGGKWKTLILWYLLTEGPKRFNELKKMLPTVSHKTLSKQLKDLEEDLLISRTVFAEVPPRVEYALTEEGASLKELLTIMCSWGRNHNRKSQDLIQSICNSNSSDEQ
jgi:DNA-binding HxlR family transcriptional regulator